MIMIIGIAIISAKLSIPSLHAANQSPVCVFSEAFFLFAYPDIWFLIVTVVVILREFCYPHLVEAL